MSALSALGTAPIGLPAAANGPARDRVAHAEAGAILLACPVVRGGAVLFGWHGARMPRQGIAVLEGGGDGARGPFRLHAWRRDSAGTAWFIAAVQARDPDRVPAGAAITILTRGDAGIALGALPGEWAAPDAFAERLAAAGAGQAGPIALFLADLAAAAPRSPAARDLFSHFLRLASVEDGVIEIVGGTAETTMLQGWGRHGAVEPATVLLRHPFIARHAATVATFARTDLVPPATGMVMLLDQSAGADPAALDAIHVVSGGVLCRRPVLPSRQLLGAVETAGHLRDICPRLSADAETMQALQRLMRPRFAGHDTVSALDRPVRAAVDLAVLLPDVGAYLCGWLVDPDGEVQQVSLANRAGERLRLDRGWTRLPRPDVGKVFREDARFAGLDPDRPIHGFAAFVGDPVLAAGRDGLHLDLAVGETAAFLPVRPARGSPRALLRRILESIDLHQPGGYSAIVAQLGPLLQAMLRQGLPLPDVETIRRATATPRRALLIPLAPAAAPPHAALSFLLADPPQAEEGLVLVAPPCWGERELARLDRALALYGLDATLLRAAEPCTWVEALELAARATDAPSMLCLGANVTATRPGWREALAARHGGRDAPSVLFPTALFEDDSVRSVGVASVETSATPPWAVLRRPLAGMPVVAGATAPQACLAGSLAGALVPRAAWQQGQGFAGGALLDEAQEFAFFHRLARAGIPFAHAPAIVVHAVDRLQAGPPPRWHQAARLIDGWLIAQSDRGGSPA